MSILPLHFAVNNFILQLAYVNGLHVTGTKEDLTKRVFSIVNGLILPTNINKFNALSRQPVGFTNSSIQARSKQKKEREPESARETEVKCETVGWSFTENRLETSDITNKFFVSLVDLFFQLFFVRIYL